MNEEPMNPTTTNAQPITLVDLGLLALVCVAVIGMLFGVTSIVAERAGVSIWSLLGGGALFATVFTAIVVGLKSLGRTSAD